MLASPGATLPAGVAHERNRRMAFASLRGWHFMRIACRVSPRQMLGRWSVNSPRVRVPAVRLPPELDDVPVRHTRRASWFLRKHAARALKIIWDVQRAHLHWRWRAGCILLKLPGGRLGAPVLVFWQGLRAGVARRFQTVFLLLEAVRAIAI